MSEKRRDSKGRLLRNGEVQRSDGRYMYRYVDLSGKRQLGEALGLRWSDCDFEEDFISVNHTLLYKPIVDKGYAYRISAPKTKAGIRVIPMFADAKNALIQEHNRRRPNLPPFIVDGYTDFIFLNSNGKVFTPSYIFDRIQGIVASYNKIEAAKAEQEKREPCYLPKFSAHILRHTFCTRLCEHESNLKVIQEVLGHRNISTTMDVYNEATTDKKLASFQNLEGKIRLA